MNFLRTLFCLSLFCPIRSKHISLSTMQLIKTAHTLRQTSWEEDGEREEAAQTTINSDKPLWSKAVGVWWGPGRRLCYACVDYLLIFVQPIGRQTPIGHSCDTTPFPTICCTLCLCRFFLPAPVALSSSPLGGEKCEPVRLVTGQKFILRFDGAAGGVCPVLVGLLLYPPLCSYWMSRYWLPGGES